MLLPLVAEGLIMVMGEGGGSGFGVFLQNYLHDKDFKQTVIYLSLGIIVAAITLSIVFSIIFPPKEIEKEEFAEKLDAE